MGGGDLGISFVGRQHGCHAVIRAPRGTLHRPAHRALCTLVVHGHRLADARGMHKCLVVGGQWRVVRYQAVTDPDAESGSCRGSVGDRSEELGPERDDGLATLSVGLDSGEIGDTGRWCERPLLAAHSHYHCARAAR